MNTKTPLENLLSEYKNKGLKLTEATAFIGSDNEHSSPLKDIYEVALAWYQEVQAIPDCLVFFLNESKIYNEWSAEANKAWMEEVVEKGKVIFISHKKIENIVFCSCK